MNDSDPDSDGEVADGQVYEAPAVSSEENADGEEEDLIDSRETDQPSDGEGAEESLVEEPGAENQYQEEDASETEQLEEDVQYQEPTSPESDPDAEFQQQDEVDTEEVYEPPEEVTVEHGEYEAEEVAEEEEVKDDNQVVAEEVAGEEEYQEDAQEEVATEEVSVEQEDVEGVPEEVAEEQSYNQDADDAPEESYDAQDPSHEEYVGEEIATEQEYDDNKEDHPEDVPNQDDAEVEVGDKAQGADGIDDSYDPANAQVDSGVTDSGLVQEEVSNRNDSDEDDFDNVVEVEEHKAESDEEDENVAQHVSDSENEEENVKGDEIKLGDVSEDDLQGASSGSENEASDDDNNVSPTKKRKVISSDDEDEGKATGIKANDEAVLKMFDSDSEDEQKEDGVGELIADIFGESDDEEEFTGFGQEEISNNKSQSQKPLGISDESDSEPAQEYEKDSEDEETVTKKVGKKKAAEEESDSDEGVRDSKSEAISDFDLMLQRKKEENRKRRRRKDGGMFISDADDIINAMLTKMKEAAEADREANQKRKPALSKLKMLPSVVAHLKKQDLKEAFVDNGVIAAIADWLSLLPDRSLPHITIRTELLKILHELPPVSAGTLKQSGIGKSVMILFKHPREIRMNKDSAGRLINKWSRPIFGLNENFKSMSREEREQRDLEQMPQAKRRRLSSGATRQAEEGRGEGELGHLRPGEQGFVMRARVPMPSTKDYVVRPKWNVETSGPMDDDDEEGAARIQKRRRSAGAPRSSKKDERLEKHMRNFAERKKSSKMQRAVKISIEGNKMSIM